MMASLPFYRKEMRNKYAGGTFKTTSSGVGDLTLTSIARFMRREYEETFVHLELGAPTGSVTESDQTPFGRVRLPYPMQLGSGVWHLETGLSYRGNFWRYTWGGQATTLFRMGKNDEGYRPGNLYRVTGWVGRQWLEDVSSSIRLEWRRWENVAGQDDLLDPSATPVNDPLQQLGERLDLGFGFDLGLPYLDSQTLELEATIPVWEWLDGPQPSFDWQVRAGLRWSI